jgi:predicted amino acid-binding ACT domain protein
LQCDLLQRFAVSDIKKSNRKLSDEAKLKKRIEKEKRKLGHKLFVQNLLLIEEELKELKTVDSTLARAKIDYKNLTTQLFSERFTLAMTSKNKLSQ